MNTTKATLDGLTWMEWAQVERLAEDLDFLGIGLTDLVSPLEHSFVLDDPTREGEIVLSPDETKHMAAAYAKVADGPPEAAETFLAMLVDEAAVRHEVGEVGNLNADCRNWAEAPEEA